MNTVLRTVRALRLMLTQSKKAEAFAKAANNNHFWRMVAGIEPCNTSTLGWFASEVSSALKSNGSQHPADPSDAWLLDWGIRIEWQIAASAADRNLIDKNVPPPSDYFISRDSDYYIISGKHKAKLSEWGLVTCEKNTDYFDCVIYRQFLDGSNWARYLYHFNRPNPNWVRRMHGYLTNGWATCLKPEPDVPWEYLELVPRQCWPPALVHWWDTYGSKESGLLAEVRRSLDVLHSQDAHTHEDNEDLKELEDLYQQIVGGSTVALNIATMAERYDGERARCERLVAVEGIRRDLVKVRKSQQAANAAATEVNNQITSSQS